MVLSACARTRNVAWSRPNEKGGNSDLAPQPWPTHLFEAMPLSSEATRAVKRSQTAGHHQLEMPAGCLSYFSAHWQVRKRWQQDGFAAGSHRPHREGQPSHAQGHQSGRRPCPLHGACRLAEKRRLPGNQPSFEIHRKRPSLMDCTHLSPYWVKGLALDGQSFASATSRD